MTKTARAQLIEDIKIRLGSGIVDNELDPAHYEYAVTRSLDRYRQRSGNSVEESFVFLDVQPDTSVYTLPKEVQEVRSIYRRFIGGAGQGSQVDPFSLAFTNNIYMIQNPGGLGGGGAGQLATYDFAMQHQELVGRMFGRDVQYTWDVSTKKLSLHRKFTAVEQIGIHVYNARPEEILINDIYAKPWLHDYAVAYCKLIMGEARSKFASLAGPQGGITMNGDALKQEAQAEMDRLEQEVLNLIDSQEGYGFVIG